MYCCIVAPPLIFAACYVPRLLHSARTLPTSIGDNCSDHVSLRAGHLQRHLQLVEGQVQGREGGGQGLSALNPPRLDHLEHYAWLGVRFGVHPSGSSSSSSAKSTFMAQPQSAVGVQHKAVEGSRMSKFPEGVDGVMDAERRVGQQV